MLKHRKLTRPFSLLVVSLILLLVGCGDIDDESSDFFTDTFALEADSLNAEELDSDRYIEETAAETETEAEADTEDEDIVVKAANEKKTECPFADEAKCMKQCPDGTHYGTTYSWDSDTWTCTTSGVNPYGPSKATLVRTDIVGMAANEEQNECPYADEARCMEQCPDGTHYGTTYSWDSDTWTCTTSGVNPYDSFEPVRMRKR